MALNPDELRKKFAAKGREELQREEEVFRQLFKDIARDHSRAEILSEIEKLDKRHYAWIRIEAARLTDRRVEQLDAMVGYHPPITQSPNGEKPQKTQTPEKPKLRQLSSVEMLPIRFVDKPLFQADAFHLLVGKKNAGKGTFLSSVAARVTRGELGEKRNVIWIAAGEDSLALDVRPRIEAAGGDVTRAYYPPFIPKLPVEVGLLQKWAEDLGGVGFIALDPVSGMVPSHFNSHLDSDVQPVISSLNDLADNLKCTVVGVRHLKKDASAGALESVLGSIAWVNVPRAVLAIVWDKTDGIRYVQVVAGNRVPGGSESVGFRIVGADVVPGGEPVAQAVFVEGPGKDVDELLSSDVQKDSPTKTKRAAMRILDILEESGGEKLKQDDVFNRVAEELHMSPKTIRVKAYFGILHDLGLVNAHKDGFKGGWFIGRSHMPRPSELI